MLPTFSLTLRPHRAGVGDLVARARGPLPSSPLRERQPVLLFVSWPTAEKEARWAVLKEVSTSCWNPRA